LTFSYHIAKQIHDYAKQNPKNSKNSYELCLFVYNEIDAFLESAICLGKLGRFNTLLELILKKNEILNRTDVLGKILKESSSVDLAFLFLEKLVN
jgi:hypothetical protein